MYDRTIVENPQVRASDNKVFTSVGGKQFNGRRCRAVKALEKGELDWDVAIGKTIVELDDGTLTSVLNDELQG